MSSLHRYQTLLLVIYIISHEAAFGGPTVCDGDRERSPDRKRSAESQQRQQTAREI